MKRTMKRTALFAILALAVTSVCAKSIVLTLESGTKVYYKLSNTAPPRMIIADDGTFTMNGNEYSFSDVTNFYLTETDYYGADGTVDGIVAIENGKVEMKGEVRVYSIDGRLVQTGSDLSELPGGTYVVTDGITTFKIHKQ